MGILSIARRTHMKCVNTAYGVHGHRQSLYFRKHMKRKPPWHSAPFSLSVIFYKKAKKKEGFTIMANYNTASDCRSSQDMPAKELAETNCQANMRQGNGASCQANRHQGAGASCQANRHQGAGASCQANRHQGAGASCQANMRQRQMASNPHQMVQGCRQGTSCQGNMEPRQMAPAMHPHHMGSRPSRPSMMPPCAGQDDPLAGMVLAMAYVPWQFFNDTYEPDKALQYGTIFPELNKPFYGKGGCLK